MAGWERCRIEVGGRLPEPLEGTTRHDEHQTAFDLNPVVPFPSNRSSWSGKQPAMSASDPIADPAAFTLGERDTIRRELDRFFLTLPSVAEGFQLRTWRGGPRPA